MYKCLFVFVEGSDDRRFVENVCAPRLAPAKYDCVRVIEYAEQTPGKVGKYLREFSSVDIFDYVFLADLDDCRSITQRKRWLAERYSPLDEGKIVIVRREIESWYLAGLEEGRGRSWRITREASTDALTKEAFRSLVPKRFVSVTAFMAEILNGFSVEAAKRSNGSFLYLAVKYGW